MCGPIVMEHFAHPRNIGALEAPDAVGQAGVPGQGNYLVLHLRGEGERIVEARYQTYGCPGTIASGSVLTEWAMGKTLAEAAALTPSELEALLGGLPLGREHCASLAVEALRDALGKLGTATGERR